MKEELAGWGVGSVLTVERRKERKFGERSFGGDCRFWCEVGVISYVTVQLYTVGLVV